MPHFVFFVFLFCFFFLLCVSYPTTHELNAVACVHACKSGPFGCTPKPRRQADTVRTYTTQRLHDTDNTTCTTQWEEHDLALSLKLAIKTFVEFLKLNWSYNLLPYMLQTLFIRFINEKYTLTNIKKVQSHPTAVTKSKAHQSRPSERPSNNWSDIIKGPVLMHNNI